VRSCDASLARLSRKYTIAFRAVVFRVSAILFYGFLITPLRFAPLLRVQRAERSMKLEVGCERESRETLMRGRVSAAINFGFTGSWSCPYVGLRAVFAACFPLAAGRRNGECACGAGRLALV